MADNISSGKTSGGIPVIVEKIPDCENVGYMVGVRTGSRDEYPEIFGLSHLLEHVVFRATKTRGSYQMAKEMEGAGGQMNAFTGKEETAYYGVTIKETKDVAMDMVSDIVANPLINEDDVQLEKKIVLQELSMIENEPDSYIHDLFSTNMWRGHALCQDEGGTVDVVKKLGSAELRQYYEERYGNPNLAVFAAGAADLDETIAWAEEKFDGMSAKETVRVPPTKPTSGYFFKKNESDHCQVAMGFPAYSSSDPKRTATSLLASVIGSGTSSRLFQDVREKKALVYSVYSMIEQHSDTSAFSIYMSCTDENVIESMTTTVKSLGQLKAEGLTEGELTRTKNLLKGAISRSMESTERRLYKLGRNYMLNGTYKTLEQSLADISAVTEEEVMAVADDILKAETLNVTVLGKGNRKIKSFDLNQLDF